MAAKTKKVDLDPEIRAKSLTKKFAEAGLRLDVTTRSFLGFLRQGGAQIVQINIERKVKGSHREEWFRIFPGDPGNRLEVVNIDKKISQLVLRVIEPARDFVTVDKKGRYGFGNVGPGARILKTTDTERHVRYRTPGGTRFFLCGVDERQLFIAQLTRAVTTVKEAHASLKSPTVYLAEGKNVRVKRQGEWFFLEASEEEIETIETAVKKNRLKVHTKVAIGRFAGRAGGNPHTADEIVVTPGPVLEHGFSVRGRPEVFVRGKVRHIDHATVSFSKWRKVILNTESSNASSGAGGSGVRVGWID